MSDVRCLHRAGALPPAPRTNAAPRNRDERLAMAEFLEARLLRPLHASAARHREAIEIALDTMTPAERVYIEIDMQERRPTMHSFDYDPMRG